MKRGLLAGLTAAKTMLVMRWKLHYELSIYQWKLSFYEVLTLEASSARAQSAKIENIQTLQIVAQTVTSFL